MEKEYNFKTSADKFPKRNYQLKEDTLYERIRHHLLEGRKLSEEETHILHRWKQHTPFLFPRMKPMPTQQGS